MNKANRIDARYTVVQAIQRNWQEHLHSLNKQQFFGIVRKGHYMTFSKSLGQEWCNKMLGWYIAVQWKSWRREYIFSDFGYK